ncbi:MAG TPA: hypothetical protein VI488_05935 [Candidatus Angelobacter sp.]
MSAQIADATICDILTNPQSFDGKMVRVKGMVTAGFEEFALKDAGCNQPINAIWVAYPEGTKGKAGPAAFVQLQLGRNNPAAAAGPSRTPVKLDKNKDFKQFDSLLSTPYKAGGMCLGCIRYAVTATLVGRLDGVKEVGIVRDSGSKFVSANGYGNLNLYRARLVLQTVSDVSAHEIDYSKVSSATKDDSLRESSGGDPVAAAHQAARAFSPDSQAAKQLERAAAAYGKEGEDNGVEIGFGSGNEVPKNDGPKGDKNSPDGLLINCTFDMDRLKGEGLARAITHVGTHIADLRDPQSTAAESTAYELEYRAWHTTVLSAVATQQKTLTLPGGYLLWNSAWAAEDRDKMVDEGTTSFLRDWVVLKK